MNSEVRSASSLVSFHLKNESMKRKRRMAGTEGRNKTVTSTENTQGGETCMMRY